MGLRAEVDNTEVRNGEAPAEAFGDSRALIKQSRQTLVRWGISQPNLADLDRASHATGR